MISSALASAFANSARPALSIVTPVVTSTTSFSCSPLPSTSSTSIAPLSFAASLLTKNSCSPVRGFLPIITIS